jgi:hypothetical protein
MIKKMNIVFLPLRCDTRQKTAAAAQGKQKSVEPAGRE